MPISTRHGRPVAGSHERPRGYPGHVVPDIPVTGPSGLLPSFRVFLVIAVLVLVFLLPAYLL